ncbi:hypothetical protein E4U54_000379 [Claviceps lovelessii]|nr:hypothetical protein E4U54_000379 [Claviceps lovelessii]
MKYSTAIAAIAAAGAYADIQIVTGVLVSVGNGIDGLNTAAQSFSGNVQNVKDKADALVTAIRNGKSTVDGSPDLTLQEALGLTDPVQGLTKKGQTLLATFKDKRSDVEKANACDTVRIELRDINERSSALIKAVVAKVPKDAQVVAQSLASQLTTVLTQAQNDFSEANCKNAGGAVNPGASSQTSAAPSNTANVSQTATESVTQIASQTASQTASVTATETASETETATETTPGTTLIPSQTHVPTQGGNATATGNPPNVTAGASFLAPAGALALAVAAALL